MGAPHQYTTRSHHHFSWTHAWASPAKVLSWPYLEVDIEPVTFCTLSRGSTNELWPFGFCVSLSLVVVIYCMWLTLMEENCGGKHCHQMQKSSLDCTVQSLGAHQEEMVW